MFLTCFDTTAFLQNLGTKMTTVSNFSRQNEADLRAINVVLWENLVLIVVLVLESRAL